MYFREKCGIENLVLYIGKESMGFRLYSPMDKERKLDIFIFSMDKERPLAVFVELYIMFGNSEHSEKS